MSITDDQAAEIAKRHGLGLADAVSLRDLASDVDHAERLAKQFAPEVDIDAVYQEARMRGGMR